MAISYVANLFAILTKQLGVNFVMKRRVLTYKPKTFHANISAEANYAMKFATMKSIAWTRQNATVFDMESSVNSARCITIYYLSR